MTELEIVTPDIPLRRSPERWAVQRLAQAVLIQALNDVSKWVRVNNRSKKLPSLARIQIIKDGEDALRWINSQGLEPWCDIAGVSVKAVRQASVSKTPKIRSYRGYRRGNGKRKTKLQEKAL